MNTLSVRRGLARTCAAALLAATAGLGVYVPSAASAPTPSQQARQGRRGTVRK